MGETGALWSISSSCCALPCFEALLETELWPEIIQRS